MTQFDSDRSRVQVAKQLNDVWQAPANSDECIAQILAASHSSTVATHNRHWTQHWGLSLAIAACFAGVVFWLSQTVSLHGRGPSQGSVTPATLTVAEVDMLSNTFATNEEEDTTL